MVVFQAGGKVFAVHRPHAFVAAAMDQLGPFPPAPLLAAGVSGGADSLALALLADGWARARGGALLALIVDHGLRPAAADEASTTAALHVHL